MRIAISTVCLGAVLALCVCSSADARKPSRKTLEYQAALEAWVGRTVDELLVTYGVPQNSVDLPSGGKLLSFVGTDNVGPSDLGSKLFGEKGAILDSDSGSQYKCVVNFAIGQDGAVKAAKIQTNDSMLLIDPCSQLIKGP